MLSDHSIFKNLKNTLESLFPFQHFSENSSLDFPISNDYALPEVLNKHWREKYQLTHDNSAAIVVGESHFMKLVITLPEKTIIFLDCNSSPKQNILRQIKLINECYSSDELAEKINLESKNGNGHEYHQYYLSEMEFKQFKTLLPNKEIIFVNVDLNNEIRVKLFFETIKNKIKITFFNFTNLLPGYVSTNNIKYLLTYLDDNCSFHFSEGATDKSIYGHNKKAAEELIALLQNKKMEDIFQSECKIKHCSYVYKKPFIPEEKIELFAISKKKSV